MADAADYADSVRAYDQGNYQAAAAALRPLAEAGDTKAQVRLGLMYREGRGVSRDTETAFAWLMRAARSGRADAQYLVGTMYRRGEGVAPDLAASETWLRRAAAQGNRKAAAMLAGKAPPAAVQSAPKSMAAGEAASEAPPAANDPALIAERQTILAAMDPPASAAEIAAIDKANAHGIKINYGSLDAHAAAGREEAKPEKAEPILTPAVAPTSLQEVMSKGNREEPTLETAAAVGDSSTDKDGMARSSEPTAEPPQQIASIDQLERRAAAGNMAAQRQLAQSYLNGTGVARDPIRAAHWLRRAATLGDAESQFILSGMYLRGEGVPRDRSVAVQWLRRAAAQGHKQAQAQLAQSGN